MKYFIGYPCLMAKNEERNAAITSQNITFTTYAPAPQKVKHRFVRTPKRFVSAKYCVRILQETCFSLLQDSPSREVRYRF